MNGTFSYVDTEGADLSGIQKKAVMKKEVEAPVKKGTKLGDVKYYLNDKEIGSLPVTAENSVKEINYPYAVKTTFGSFLL